MKKQLLVIFVSALALSACGGGAGTGFAARIVPDDVLPLTGCR